MHGIFIEQMQFIQSTPYHMPAIDAMMLFNQRIITRNHATSPIADLKKRICGNISFVVWDFLFATLILQTENIRWFSREKNVSQLNWRSRVRHSPPYQHDRKQFKKIMRRQKSIKHIRTQTHSVLTAAHLFNGKLTNNNNIIRMQTSIKLLLLFGWLAGCFRQLCAIFEIFWALKIMIRCMFCCWCWCWCGVWTFFRSPYSFSVFFFSSIDVGPFESPSYNFHSFPFGVLQMHRACGIHWKNSDHSLINCLFSFVLCEQCKRCIFDCYYSLSILTHLSISSSSCSSSCVVWM